MSATAATAAWLVSAMLSWSPPGFGFWSDTKETAQEGKARYEQIADAVVKVAYDKSEPSLFGGKYGRARTAMLMLSVAYFESGFRKDVDLGPCHKGSCDGGLSACMLQIQIGSGTTAEGWTQKDLFADREKCFRAGLHLMRKSFHACHDYPLLDRLSAYAAGRCYHNSHPSQVRLDKAIRWFGSHNPPLHDEAVFMELYPVVAEEEAGSTTRMMR